MLRSATAMMLTLALAAGAAPRAAAAQSCGLVAGSGVELSAGPASYDIGAGLAGPVFGAGFTLAVPFGSARLDYMSVRLDGPDPQIGRFAGALPLPFRPGGTAICVIARAGGSRLTVDDEITTVLAGGLGLRIARPLAMDRIVVRPYGEVRGLRAETNGTLLGVEVGGSGLAVGVEGGVRASLGRLTLAVSGSLDGLAPGLGLTPYPARSVVLGLGVGF